MKNHEPTGKLQVYDQVTLAVVSSVRSVVTLFVLWQSTWNWPPTGGVEQTQTTQSVFVKSPRLYDPTASRNMDIHRNVCTLRTVLRPVAELTPMTGGDHQ